MRISDWSSDVCSSDLGDMRAHEGSSATRHFLSFRVDQTRVGHIDSTLAADPASLRHNRPFGERLGEKQIEGCGQQKAITDQTIGRVKCCVVQHLEIASAMQSASGMIEILIP